MDIRRRLSERERARRQKDDKMAAVILPHEQQKTETKPEPFRPTKHRVAPGPDFGVQQSPPVRKKPEFKVIPDDPRSIPDPRVANTKIVWLNIGLFLAVLLFASIIAGKIYQQQVANKSAATKPASSLASPSTEFSAAPGARNSLTATSATPTPEPTQTETPRPALTTAVKTLAKSELKLQVLNGNGKTGDASTVASKIRAAGYTNVTTGNAKNFQFTKTIIYYQTGYKTEAEEIAQVLSGRATSVEESSISPQIQVVVGKT